MKIVVTTAGSGSMREYKMREAIEKEVQARINKGLLFLAMGSRGGTMYLVFGDQNANPSS